MDWKNWLGRINRWAQNAWFWSVLIFSVVSGSLMVLGRATEVFQTWAPLSYGVVFWIAALLAFLCLAPVRKLIPNRKNWAGKLSELALRTSAQIRSHSPTVSETVDDAIRSVYSTSLSFKAEGFPFPTFPNGARPTDIFPVAEHYFGTVGLLLREGHINEARAIAQSLTDIHSLKT